MFRRFTIPTAATLVVAAVFAVAAWAVNGELNFVQCVSPSGGTCATANALDDPVALAVATDETYIFAASNTSDSVAIFGRDKKYGRLTQLGGLHGCISETGTGGLCFDGRALDGASDVVSRDNNAYVAAADSNAVTLVKASSGLAADWSQPADAASCISEDGTGGACVDGRALTGAASIAIKPGYGTVYVGGQGAIAVFSRNKQNGYLTQLDGTAGCVSDDGSGGECALGFVPDTVRDMVVTMDGRFLYAAASGPGDGAVLVFSIDPTTGALTQLPGQAGCLSDDGSAGQCTDARALLRPEGVANDFDNTGGYSVYVAANGSDAVSVFSRDKVTGALTQRSGTEGCVSETGSGGQCTDGRNLVAPHRVNVYKTNKFVEVTSGEGIANFGRNKKTGVLAQLAGKSGCTTETGNLGTCLTAHGMAGAVGIVSTGGGKNVYVTGTTLDSIAVTKLK